MRKALLALILLFVAPLLLSQSVRAEEETTGNLVIHFQKWDGDYTTFGLNTWGIADALQPAGVGGWKRASVIEKATKQDDFGAYWEINNVPYAAEGGLGFQVVQELESGEADWNNGMLANHEIPLSKVVPGKTVHIYMFQGGQSREVPAAEQATALYADPDKQGIIVTYYDASNNYEEKLGFHSWGWATGGNAAGWNDPLQLFENVGKSAAGIFVKAAILYYADPVKSPGAIIYYGDGDNSKKTGNIEPMNAENPVYIETPKAAGQLDVVYAVNKGNGNGSNNNVWLNQAETFAVEAFAFGFVAYKAAEEGKDPTGTYAVDSKTIIATVNQELANIYVAAQTEEEKEVADATIKSWFEVKEITSAVDAAEETYGPSLPFARLDYAKGVTNTTVKDFVITLENALDNQKRYKVFFNDGQEGDAARTADLELNLDTEKPVITFISPTGIIGKPAGERVIVVPWGVKFDQNLFPGFRALDDRDGDLTVKVFVPKGENSVLDTRKEGDYTIVLEVSDKWGNVTRETFIFRVTKKK